MAIFWMHQILNHNQFPQNIIQHIIHLYKRLHHKHFVKYYQLKFQIYQF